MLWSTVVQAGYTAEKMTLGQITILGVEKPPSSVMLNGEPVQSFSYTNKVCV